MFSMLWTKAASGLFLDFVIHNAVPSQYMSLSMSAQKALKGFYYCAPGQSRMTQESIYFPKGKKKKYFDKFQVDDFPVLEVRKQFIWKGLCL